MEKGNRDEILRRMNKKNYQLKRDKRLKERKKTDEQFCRVEEFKKRLSEVLYKQKRDTWIRELNCKREFFLDWIEYQFGETFTWETYNREWILDFVNVTQEESCFYWYNLKPVCKNQETIFDLKSHERQITTFKKSWVPN